MIFNIHSGVRYGWHLFNMAAALRRTRGIHIPSGRDKKAAHQGMAEDRSQELDGACREVQGCRRARICQGRRSNVTVLDIDTTDEKVAQDAIRRHGQPAIITRTASGKFHHLYQYNGERRRIRPWSQLPIDVLGDNGYAVAAPSKLASGSYEIIHGHLDDLDRLTPMVGLEKITTAPVPAKFSGMRTGDGRNRALWERCMRAGAGRSLDGMLEIARNANEHFKERLMEAEVVKIATSAWQHDVAGLNFFTRPRIMLGHDVFDSVGAQNQDAVFLLLKLDRHHGGNDKFILSKAMAPTLGWSWPRWYAARNALVDEGIIKCIRPGGRGPNDPPVYGWVLKG